MLNRAKPIVTNVNRKHNAAKGDASTVIGLLVIKALDQRMINTTGKNRVTTN